jgi:hypothetical protein
MYMFKCVILCTLCTEYEMVMPLSIVLGVENAESNKTTWFRTTFY